MNNTRRLMTFTFVLTLIYSSTSLVAATPSTHSESLCKKIPEAQVANLSEHLAPYQEKMQYQTGVYVLEQGTEALLSRAWLSDQAQTSIDVQYFIFSVDNVGLIAIDYLVKAAERGVEVRVLVDDIMIEAKEEELLALASLPNLSIKIYNPSINIGKSFIDKVLALTTNFHGVNQRMHNKTFTVDGQVTITGGRNIADEYFGYDHTYNFRDRDVLLLGSEVKKVESSFNDFWEHPLSVPVERVLSKKKATSFNRDYSKLHEYACNPVNFLPVVRKQIASLPNTFSEIEKNADLYWLDDVAYISDIPGKNQANKFLAGGGESTSQLLALARSAKKSLTIQTPYLISTDLSKNLFKELTARGVQVKILTNSLASTDNLEAFSGYQRDRKALLATGVEIYEFKPKALIRQKIMSKEMNAQLVKMPIFGLHAKTMIVDERITVIGTFNLDPRSANLNTESITIIPSDKLSLQVKEGMVNEMKQENAWRITADWNPDHTVGKIKQLAVKLRRIVPKNIL